MAKEIRKSGSIGKLLTVSNSVRCQGVKSLARRVGCHEVHLSYVLHGRRKANDDLRRRLKRLGVTHDVNGDEL